MFEFFIARRYLKSKRKLNFISIISMLSGIGIMIGVAALVIVLSVFNGFASIVKGTLINFDPHMRVMLNNENKDYDKILEFINSDENVIGALPFVEGQVILSNGSKYEILNLRGLDHDSIETDWGVGNTVILGKGEYKNHDGNEILLSLPMRLRLNRSVGDNVLISTFDEMEKSLTGFMIPKTFKSEITGVFRAYNKNYDYGYVFTSLSYGKRILAKKYPDGIDVRFNDIEYANTFSSKLSKFDSSLVINTWFDLHKDLYLMMQIERWSAFILLSLIIAIGTFNILGSLTMTVLEKRKDIAILKTMGANNNSILRIFMFEGMLVGIIGTAAGMAIGLSVYFMQIYFKIYSLDTSKYIVDALPVNLYWYDILAITLTSVLLSYLASLYPARRAVKQNITESIKWE